MFLLLEYEEIFHETYTVYICINITSKQHNYIYILMEEKKQGRLPHLLVIRMHANTSNANAPLITS